MKKHIATEHANVARAWQQGVPIALGTDAGIVPHGQNAIELDWYVRLGMTPMQAIESGTTVAARVVGMEKDLGTLEIGKIADVIATAKSPLEDIKALQSVHFVMKDGRVYVGAATVTAQAR